MTTQEDRARKVENLRERVARWDGKPSEWSRVTVPLGELRAVLAFAASPESGKADAEVGRWEVQAETYRDMHAIAVKELGYPSILEALEATPPAAICAPLDEGINDTEAEAHEWVRKAYREPDDISQLDAYRFTRWNMAVAYHAGKRAALFLAPHQEQAIAGDTPIPAGMKPWSGGDSAPADWDGGPVLFREAGMSAHTPAYLTWKRGFRENPFDIIAYTPTPSAGVDVQAIREAKGKSLDDVIVEARRAQKLVQGCFECNADDERRWADTIQWLEGLR